MKTIISRDHPWLDWQAKMFYILHILLINENYLSYVHHTTVRMKTTFSKDHLCPDWQAKNVLHSASCPLYDSVYEDNY